MSLGTFKLGNKMIYALSLSTPQQQYQCGHLLTPGKDVNFLD